MVVKSIPMKHFISGFLFLCALAPLVLTASILCEERNAIPTYRDPEGMCSACSKDACLALIPTPNECLCHCQKAFPNKSFVSKDGYRCPVIQPLKDDYKEKDDEQNTAYFDGKDIGLTIGWTVIPLLLMVIVYLKFKKQICKKICKCLGRRLQKVPQVKTPLLDVSVKEPDLQQPGPDSIVNDASIRREAERGGTPNKGVPSLPESGYDSVPPPQDGQSSGYNPEPPQASGYNQETDPKNRLDDGYDQTTCQGQQPMWDSAPTEKALDPVILPEEVQMNIPLQ